MASEKSKEDNTMPILVHLLGLFFYLIGPLIIFAVAEKNKDKRHAKIALNWHLSSLIYGIVGAILVFVFIGFFILSALYVVHVVFSIIAVVKAGEGKFWKYPLSIPFFRV